MSREAAVTEGSPVDDIGLDTGAEIDGDDLVVEEDDAE
jgi:hypothetical protein